MALGHVGDPADGDCLVATAHRADATTAEHGRLDAVLHFVPSGTDGASLDLMRRDRSADPRMNELLIVAALQAAPGFRIARVSLDFAMFRSAPDGCWGPGAGCWSFSPAGFRSNPGKVRRHVPGRAGNRVSSSIAQADLPRIGFAAMQAEGFLKLALPLPRFLRRRTPLRPPDDTGTRPGTGGKQPPRTA